MRVRDLIKRLATENPNADVVLASDPDGSTFSVLEDIEELKHIEFQNGKCDVFIKELTREMIDEGFTQEDFGDSADAVPCIVFWPKY